VWVEEKLLRAADPQQIAEESRIDEVQLRRLDQAFADVPMPGRQTVGYVSSFQDRQPGPGRVVGNPCVRAERGQVQELAAISLGLLT